jgi:hypothetical protein
MRASLFLFVGIFVLLATSCARPPAPAQLALVTPEYFLGMDLSDERWEIRKKAPEFLIAEMAEHLGHEMEETHPEITPAQLRKATEKRLNVNELFIFNRQSHARLVIDFSALREGEPPPSRKIIAASADFAGQGLTNEEGISHVAYKTSRTRLSGASSAYRLEADFNHHGETIKLVGIVGFADPYWFYFYYTDPLNDPADLLSMENLFKSFMLIPAGAK